MPLIKGENIMATKLEQFIRQTYNAYPILLSSEKIIPGILIQSDWGWFNEKKHPDFKRIEDLARYRLDMNDQEWQHYKSSFSKGSIIAGSIEDSFDFGISFPLLQYGIKEIAGRIKRGRKSTLTIGSIVIRAFDNGFCLHDLRRELWDLRNTNRDYWKDVDNDFLVSHCYHTANLKWEFEEEGELSAEVDFTAAGLKVGGDLKWDNGETLVFTGTSEAPFAVQGVKI